MTKPFVSKGTGVKIGEKVCAVTVLLFSNCPIVLLFVHICTLIYIKELMIILE